MSFKKKEIAILIVTHHRTKLLEKCLNSIVEAKPVDGLNITIFLCLNPSTQEDLNLVANIKAKNLNFNWHIIENQEKKNPPIARNQLLKLAQGFDWYLFIDDDAYYEKNYFQNLEQIIKDKPEYSIFGGPNLLPPNSGNIEKDSDLLLRSIFCGPFRRRYAKLESKKVNEKSLILCNLAVKAHPSVFFQHDLPLGEENELIIRLNELGQQAYYCEDLIVYHYRRNDWFEFLLQIKKYGKGRGYIIERKYPFWILGTCFAFVISLILNLFLLPISSLFYLYLRKIKDNPVRTTLVMIPFWMLFAYFTGILIGFYFSFTRKKRELGANFI